jgi:hypothetical protein
VTRFAGYPKHEARAVEPAQPDNPKQAPSGKKEMTETGIAPDARTPFRSFLLWYSNSFRVWCLDFRA